jgi:hypothetical protein
LVDREPQDSKIEGVADNEPEPGGMLKRDDTSNSGRGSRTHLIALAVEFFS